MPKIVTVVGARPQFVKAAVVSRALRGRVTEEIIHTGQHFDPAMSAVFFEELDLPAPVVNLQIGGGSHAAMTAAMLIGIERELVARRPDRVLVYGDTNSTLAAALVAAKLEIPVAHVEAGLRSFNRRMPEEVNRLLVDHVADLLFCPSQAARQLLAREGVTRGVHVVGDVMVDALLAYRPRARRPSSGAFVLATIHRAENTDDRERLDALVGALGDCPLPVVLPVHPRVRGRLSGAPANVRLVEPLPYLDMLGHLDACAFVVTDSGGLQKEAYVYGKKCVTVRDETEWTELVAAGVNRVVGVDRARIREAYVWARQPLPPLPELYGDGRAADTIAAVLA